MDSYKLKLSPSFPLPLQIGCAHTLLHSDGHKQLRYKTHQRPPYSVTHSHYPHQMWQFPDQNEATLTDKKKGSTLMPMPISPTMFVSTIFPFPGGIGVLLSGLHDSLFYPLLSPFFKSRGKPQPAPPIEMMLLHLTTYRVTSGGGLI